MSAFTLRGIGVTACIAHKQHQRHLVLIIVFIEKDCASQVKLLQRSRLSPMYVSSFSPFEIGTWRHFPTFLGPVQYQFLSWFPKYVS